MIFNGSVSEKKNFQLNQLQVNEPRAFFSSLRFPFLSPRRQQNWKLWKNFPPPREEVCGEVEKGKSKENSETQLRHKVFSTLREIRCDNVSISTTQIFKAARFLLCCAFCNNLTILSLPAVTEKLHIFLIRMRRWWQSFLNASHSHRENVTHWARMGSKKSICKVKSALTWLRSGGGFGGVNIQPSQARCQSRKNMIKCEFIIVGWLSFWGLDVRERESSLVHCATRGVRTFSVFFLHSLLHSMQSGNCENYHIKQFRLPCCELTMKICSIFYVIYSTIDCQLWVRTHFCMSSSWPSSRPNSHKWIEFHAAEVGEEKCEKGKTCW